ncbi:hypothetical protein FKX85_00870 [Echinicola soli]|uniref:Uncharacterized protein n=1 Tax=Echinicola soli TaxID=2591634 RepID=A0A514CCY0_9BACT|nr:hypothetical protein [Echinicola soli]QDH77673.1 hypothetical protein FKX85_00870 [Echinicola soli]
MNFKVVKFKHVVLGLFFFVAVTETLAQTGIGTQSPDESAVLDVSSTTKGVLIPRLALTSTTSPAPLSANVAGMIVYNTATAGTAPENVTPGFYYNDGSAWVRVADVSSQDMRFVGTNNHITKDAGIGSNGTDAGTGNNNIFIGQNTGTVDADWSNRILIGQDAGQDAQANGLIAIGQSAGEKLGSGMDVDTSPGLYIGHFAGSTTFNDQGPSHNTIIGQSAGRMGVFENSIMLGDSAGYNADGHDNILIGKGAGKSTTGDNNIVIGNGTEVAPAPGLSINQLNIGNWIYGDDGVIGIGTTAPKSRLDVNGYVKLGSEDLKSTSGSDADREGMIRYGPNKTFQYHNDTDWVTMASTTDADITKDAWVDDPANDMVKLGTLSDGITARTAGTEFVAKDDGRVGIGTSNPVWELDVRGSRAIGQFKRITSGATNTSAGFLFTRARGMIGSEADIQAGDFLGKLLFRGRTGGADVDYATMAFVAKSTTAEDGRYAFFTGGAAFEDSELMTILSPSGNVGINKVNPLNKLVVKGEDNPPTSGVVSEGTNATLRVDGSGHNLDFGTYSISPWGGGIFNRMVMEVLLACLWC